jgi:hypothetical protein
LRELQSAFPSINSRLKDRRDSLEDDVIRNMLEGYAYVDWAVHRGIDMLGMGHLATLLELNSLVLCGADEAARRNHAEHLRATEERFYGERSGGIRDIVEWYATHRGESVWKRSAGVFIRLLSRPQLFLEGNHRSGALLMSYILLREGKPPFVVTPANARAFFDPSTVIKKMGKRSIAMQFRMPGMKRRFGRFLKDHADARYLGG